MRSKYVKVIPCLLVIILMAVLDFNGITSGYEDLINDTGYLTEDFEEELKNENLRAAEEEEEEYQRLLSSENGEEEIQKETTTVATKPSLHALSALLMDGSNNRVLYEENGYKEMPMASTTKIMTCIIALENADLADVVTVSSYAARMPDVQLNVNTGEQYYLKDLLYSLMLESHNDVAVAIAEHVGGSVEGFATMMNDKARQLGCNNTNFVTPNGLDAAGHYTTARDLAVIASYAIKDKTFIDITNTPSHSFKELKKGRSFRVTNKNKFLYMMDGAIGVKTGFTGKAGYCFVGAIKQPDRTLISVVLGCGWPPNKNLKWSDTKELMTYGIKNFKLRQIFEDKKIEPVHVKRGQLKYVPLELEGNLKLLMGDDETVTIQYDLPEQLEAPVKAKSVVGKAKYYINDIPYTELPIYTTMDIPKIDYSYCLKKLYQLWSLQY